MLLPGPFVTSGGAIRDRLGRRVMLRGANLSGRHKQPPFTSIERPEQLDAWRDVGWNAMRLVIPWEAVEPERGRIDGAYLDRVAGIAKAAGERGVHVIADFHQDIYARAFGGSGAPAWSIAPGDRPAEEPAPDRWWFLRYGGSEEVRRSLARFWSNADGIQDCFLGALSALSRRLAEEPAVIGIEPWNEPFPGERPFETFDAEDLGPFLRRAIAAARKEAPHWLAFVEGMVLASETGTTLDLGGVEGLVYFPHFYDKVVTTSLAYGGEAREMEKAFRTFARDAARMGAPWLLGEYGVSADTEGKERYVRDHQRALMALGAGGTAWHYNPTDQDWNDERMGFVPSTLAELAHPYPAAIHGEQVAARLDDAGFALEWTSAGDAHPTEIALPSRWTDVECKLPCERAGTRLRISAPEGAASVTIRAP